MKAVIFDMDGLLLDTEKIAYKVFNNIISEYGLRIDLNTYANFVGLTKEGFSVAIRKELDSIENLQNVVNYFYSELKKELSKSFPSIKEGALQLINYLKEHDIPIAVATSTHEGQAMHLLNKTNLLEYFDVVVTGDMVAKSKPSPDIFLETFKQLRVSHNHTFILEDSSNGIRAAYASEAKPILIPDMKMPSEKVRTLAVKIYPSLIEFLNDLKNGIIKI